ncbi:hypothetical protein BDZ89DRAFT_1073989 [Hymenopellis radicata]|nr:hypothetical protein BDZ89DRAFT_1073989 [Hymenopellis radicata]
MPHQRANKQIPVRRSQGNQQRRLHQLLLQRPTHLLVHRRRQEWNMYTSAAAPSQVSATNFPARRQSSEVTTARREAPADYDLELFHDIVDERRKRPRSTPHHDVSKMSYHLVVVARQVILTSFRTGSKNSSSPSLSVSDSHCVSLPDTLP